MKKHSTKYLYELFKTNEMLGDGLIAEIKGLGVRYFFCFSLTSIKKANHEDISGFVLNYTPNSVLTPDWMFLSRS